MPGQVSSIGGLGLEIGMVKVCYIQICMHLYRHLGTTLSIQHPLTDGRAESLDAIAYD
jgi:hypothetical protein